MKNFVKRVENWVVSRWQPPLLLLLVTLVAYGVWIRQLGFFQDDWYLIWAYLQNGPRAFIDFFATQRVFLAGVYMFTVSLVGSSPQAWQIFALLTRFGMIFTAWWSLRLVWHQQRRAVTLVALLMAVYPGFSQHYAALVYSQVYVVFALFFVSLGLMLLALRQPRYFWLFTVLSLTISLFCMVTTEYFFGLEAMRPLMLWFVAGETEPNGRARLKRTARWWLPYLLVAAGFFVYRIFFFHSTLYEPKAGAELLQSPLSAGFGLLQTVLQDWFDAVWFAWLQTLNFVRQTYSSIWAFVLPWLILSVSGALLAAYAWVWERREPETRDTSAWARQAALLGLAASVCAGGPYWIAGLSVELTLPNDRFTLAFMPGAALLLGALLIQLGRTSAVRAALFGALMGLSIAYQIGVGQFFAQIHAQHAALFQQLALRAPMIDADVNLLINDLPYPATGNASMNTAYHWVYAETPTSARQVGRLLYIPDKLGSEFLPDLTPAAHTARLVAAYYAPPGCLQVFDAARHFDLPRLPDDLRAAIPFSQTRFIQRESAEIARRNVTFLFGWQKTPDWCAYFEQADLARQFEDWQTVVNLGEQAFAANLQPAYKYESEYLPFIEGYGMVGDWQQAAALTRRARDNSPALAPVLCQTWARLLQNTADSAPRAEVWQTLSPKLECP